MALASVLFADEAAALEACCAAAAAVDWDAAAAEAVLRDEEVDAAAACAAWFRVLFKVGFVPSRFDRTIPSLKPHRPPAMRPEAWVDAQVRMLLCLLNANKIPCKAPTYLPSMSFRFHSKAHHPNLCWAGPIDRLRYR